MFGQIVVGVNGQGGGREAIASARRLFAPEAELSQRALGLLVIGCCALAAFDARVGG